MARTDRLMRLVDAMRRLPKPLTAARLAEETGVSQRQLYRDIATLRAGGALIDGEAGVGYRLVEDPALPPQSFSQLEIEALGLAVQALNRIGDDELIEAGRAAFARIVATLPERLARQALHAITRSFSIPPSRQPPQIDLALIRAACWAEDALLISYTDAAGRLSERVIWPLGLSYSEQALVLLAHCRLRMDFRLFHVSKIDKAARTGDSFRPNRVALVRQFVRQRAASVGQTGPQSS